MIHQFKDGQWLPGPAHREGNHPFPDHPAPGQWFNDASGAVGATLAEVVDDLRSLLMRQGSLPQLLPVPFDWSGLMGGLHSVAGGAERFSLKLMKITLRPDGSAALSAMTSLGSELSQGVGLLAQWVIASTGQLDFLRRQPWHAAGTHRVTVEVILQRGVALENLSFHKDSDGHELFVNLLFRNDEPIPATEWSVDLQPMPAAKRDLMARYWPAALLSSIEDARYALAAQAAAHPPVIAGGLLPVDGHVSWVDELVWHSIPVVAHRDRYSLADVLRLLSDPEFSSDDHDIMVQIAQSPASAFAALLPREGLSPDTLTEAAAEQLWSVMHGDARKADLLAALKADARRIDWAARPLDVSTGLGLSHADRDGQLKIIQPTGMSGRPRANSEDIGRLVRLPGADAPRFILAMLVGVEPVH